MGSLEYFIPQSAWTGTEEKVLEKKEYSQNILLQGHKPWKEGPIPVQSCTGFKRASLQVDIRVSPHGALQN